MKSNIFSKYHTESFLAPFVVALNTVLGNVGGVSLTKHAWEGYCDQLCCSIG